MSATLKFVNVTFDYPGKEPVTCPVEDVFAWADEQALAWHPHRATYEEGGKYFETFAKGWWTLVGEKYRLSRIGAGANGDTLIIQRRFESAKVGAK